MDGLAVADDTTRIILDQAGRLFSQHVTRDVLAGADEGVWPEALWREIEEAGLPLALVTEERGGIGLPVGDAMRLIRLAAYHALPLPLAETMLANRLWSDAGGDPPSGVVTLAPSRSEPRLDLIQDGGAFRMTGRVTHVPWGAAGQVLLLAGAKDGATYLVLHDARSCVSKRRRNLASEPRDDLSFEDVPVAAERVRPASGLHEHGFMLHGALIRAQQLVGAMQRCLDIAVQYANLRVQFGRQIGKFQAVQQMLAVAAGHIAAATAAADQALEAYEERDFALLVAIAKARCGEAAGQVAGIAHQVHGAIGFTKEHELHLLTRRLWSWRDEFGAESYWQERIGRLVCARGGEALWPLLLGE